MDQENGFAELNGTISGIIFKNEENGYTVLKLLDENGQQHTVVGTFPYASAGESVIVSGNWVTHPTHGLQFKAEFAQRMLPTTANAIYDFLAGGAVKGIGPATASLIVGTFGDRTLEVLENEPEKLSMIRGISAAKARSISHSFHQQAGMRRLMEFICSFGLRPVLAMRMYRFYGDRALELLRGNPYILTFEHIGGSFSEADAMANELGIEYNNPVRVAAGVLFELDHNAENGHCFIPREKLAAATSELIGVEPESVEESIGALIESGQLRYEEIAGCRACYLPALYEAERGVAEEIARMSRRKYVSRVDLPGLIGSLEDQLGIRYAPQQRQTLELALENQILIITGGPGTGKTTSIRAILSLYDRLGLNVLLTAPTGRAAKRMAELTGREAVTVHRLLEARFDEDGRTVLFSKNRNDQLDCDALILDESSMIDVPLMDAVLSALPSDARLVMVGDADQLPPIGPGNVFSAIIRSGVVPLVRLTEIFRQKENSRIVRNAHMINRGEHPDLSRNEGDFYRLKRFQAGTTAETITELCARRLPDRMHIPPEEIQVLSPTRKGELGTVNLNRRLQQALNPSAPDRAETIFGEAIFRVGDRVMQIRNNYDLIWRTADGTTSDAGIFNGDVGRICAVDLDEENLTVDFDGRLVTYPFDGLLELEHAWAMTVHKAQGNEYRAVVMALSPTASMLLTRDVLYTAVTRAKELLILVGDDQIAFQMIDNYRQNKRYCALRVRLKKLCGDA